MTLVKYFFIWRKNNGSVKMDIKILC